MSFISNILAQAGGAIATVLGIVGVLILLALLGVTYIPNNKVGIVEKKLSSKPKQGGIMSLNGEAGFQAKVLRGGWYFRFRFIYSVHKMDLITIPAGQMGYVYARDGKTLPAGQILSYVIKDAAIFEDVESFLNYGGQKGPQSTVLNSGTYAINLAQFIILTEGALHYMPLGIAGEKNIIENMDKVIRNRDGYRPVIISEDKCGIVTVHDGPSLDKGELIAKPVEGHNSYQEPDVFINEGGTKGIQVYPITNGTYYINALFATVEEEKKVEIPIGMVGVVNYFTGEESEDLSGSDYQHGELVVNGCKGVWVKALEAGKYAWNKYAGTIYKVPTTNFVLKWESQVCNDHKYDDKLEEVTLITKDAFQPLLPLSVVIHIDYTDAPKVIQRFGDIRTLISETIDPMVGAYFKNIGQTKTLLELIQQRSEIQNEAKEDMRSKFATYNLNLVEVLIGTPKSSAKDERIDKIYATLQDRQMAKESAITLAEQTKTQEQQKIFEEAQKSAQMQAELTQSAMEISISENKGKAAVVAATQNALKVEQDSMAEATKKRITADADLYEKTKRADADRYAVEAASSAESTKITLIGDAKANAEAKIGIAEGIKTREQVDAIGPDNYAVIKNIGYLAEALGQYTGAIVPESVISMSGEADQNPASSIFTLLLTKVLNGENIGGFTGTGVATESEAAKKMRESLATSLQKELECKEAAADSVADCGDSESSGNCENIE